MLTFLALEDKGSLIAVKKRAIRHNIPYDTRLRCEAVLSRVQEVTSKKNTENIKRLNLSAARLLLALLSWDGSERISDLPRLMEWAGLSPEQYARAFALLEQYGFIEYRDGSISVLFRQL